MASTRHHDAPRRFESAPAPPAGLYADICASIRETPAQRVDTGRRTRFALTAVLCLIPAAVVIASQLVYQRQAVGLVVGVDSTAHLLRALALLTGLTGAATFIALRRSARGSHLTSLLLAAILVAPVYAAVTLINPLHAADPFPPPVNLSPWGARCLVLAAVTGAIALASFTAALRRAIPAASGLRGAVVGAAAGAWAGLALFVFCPASEYLHLLVGHLLPVVAFTLAGAVVIPRALRP
jgi:hypothetical protein